MTSIFSISYVSTKSIFSISYKRLLEAFTNNEI